MKEEKEVHPFATKKGMALLGICAASVLVHVALVLWLTPWDPKWGPPGSPQRVLLTYVWVPPTAAFSYTILWWFIQHGGKWLAPPGEYMPGKEYSPWDVRTLVFIALYATMQAVVVSLTGGSAVIDFCYLVDGIFAVYFGTIVSYFGNALGFFTRLLLVYGATSIDYLTIGVFNDSMWATAVGTSFYWAFARGKGYRRIWRLIIPVLAIYFFHGGYYSWSIMIRSPPELWGISIADMMLRFMPLACMNWTIGAVIGETAVMRRLRAAK